MKLKIASLLLLVCASPAFATTFNIHCAQEKGSPIDMTIEGTVTVGQENADAMNVKGIVIVNTTTAPWNFQDVMHVEGDYLDVSDEHPYQTLWFKTTQTGTHYDDVIFMLTFKVTDPNQMDVQNTGVVQPRFYVNGVFLNCNKY